MNITRQPVPALPAYGPLTELQRYGMDCVHCEKTLTAEDALELGRQRHETLHGVRITWFPRSCLDCCKQAAP